MKKIHFVLLLAAVVGLSACGNSVTEETAENFKQVELPDSSVVYLNHNSKLTYDKKFNPRKVKLEGEAFFSVNNGETPFVIETEEDEEVTVLGTEFNMFVSLGAVAIEVEIGIVSIRIGTGIFKEVRRGQRIDFNRHDNGLHLGQAKHQHRSWIKAMDKDFKKSGMVLKRSNKHANKSFLKGNKNTGKDSKSILKGKDKGSSKSKDNKSLKPKSKSEGGTKGGKDSKAGKDTKSGKSAKDGGSKDGKTKGKN